MYNVSARFLAALAESYAPATIAQLFTTDGGTQTLEISGGSVTVDRGSVTRRTCSVTIADTSLIPRTAKASLNVYGAQLRISRGVAYSDGTSELVPLGLFRIDSIGGDVDDGPVTLAGKSLECIVQDDQFTVPYKATSSAVSAITALIQRSIPQASVINRAVDTTIGPRTWDIASDPMASVAEVAATMGAEVYADADGTFIIATLPDINTAMPVWTVAAGEGGVYVSANRSMSADKVYNAVLARGENTESGVAPVSALVTDSDPTSPTYWGGPFGRRPLFYTSSALINSVQAGAAAGLKLAAAKAPNATADLSSLPNPALEPGDVIRVVYPDGSKELHQVQSFTVPLDTSTAFAMQTISAKEGT
ncbi:DUF5047 domain-containing protein [Streptomyces xanthochromogenes]|uniref:DUF5047 domain-containing protein n=1 Tax=Streptomyces xanthochromogenes TaxID=67384 RepID=UPI0037F35E8E